MALFKHAPKILTAGVATTDMVFFLSGRRDSKDWAGFDDALLSDWMWLFGANFAWKALEKFHVYYHEPFFSWQVLHLMT